MPDSETFAALVRSQEWSTIDELVALLDHANLWSEQMLTGAVEAAKKAQIRKWIKQAKDEAGYPRWESIVQIQPDGSEVRVYKQQELFIEADYRQSIQYWVDRSQYAMDRAQTLRERARKRYGVQLLFPWEVDDAQED